ncbi:MAG TPA: acetylxylan esterase [Bryobacterales bacterium]|nr:acetylxylan esterase [Bryobacterales bacterium]
MRRTIPLFFLLAAFLSAEDFTIFHSPGTAPHEQLVRYLNNIGFRELAERDRAIAQIQTREQAEQRKKIVREKILRLIGGLPDFHGPLNVKQFGTLDRDGYRIEKIVYESLPRFYVTADVYVPAQGQGPFPAILMPVGHWEEGKFGQQDIAIGLARKGFVVLDYDPLGQGERTQYYSRDLRGSEVGGTTDEHSHANGGMSLIGDSVARYRIWDGMRGIDYLLSRQDVDATRIGCTGCSGGGTVTTYISALDERVKVAIPACYINSWQELLAVLGPQDGEQSFAHFLSEGLNIADYIELFAPKPWLSLSTIGDFFPLEGARQAYQEAKRWYGIYGAADRVQWFVGPGGHGVPQQSREALYAWFIKWLKNGEGDAREAAFHLDPPENLLCTPTGQVADSLGGETVFTLNKKRAADLIAPLPPVNSTADIEKLRARLAGEVRSAANIAVQPGGAAPALKVHRSYERSGYRLDVISYEPERGIQIPGVMLAPNAPGRKPAALVIDSRPLEAMAAPGGDLEELAKAGFLVLASEPRGVPESGAPRPRSALLGDYQTAYRAFVVGKTLVGMRAEDIIRAIDLLTSRQDIDRSKIMALGHGVSGVPLLHAAILDDRIGRVILENTLASYRDAIDRPIHRNLDEVAIPGVLRRYDLGDLLLALSPRPVTVLNPVDALGKPVRLEEFRKQNAEAMRLGRVAVEYRGLREPLLPLLGLRQ